MALTTWLEVATQVEALVQARDLLGVAVEHQGRLARSEEAAANMPFGGLAPARVVHLGIYVRIEAIFVRRGSRPGVGGLVLGEADLDDRLGALEAVFPRQVHTQRRAVLIEKYPSIDAHHHEGERMHRLVDAQALDVWSVDHSAPENHRPLARHLFGVEQR